VCVATLADGDFDPELCPMLAGLAPSERARRLSQPWIKACIDRRHAQMSSQRSGDIEPARPCAAPIGKLEPRSS